MKTVEINKEERDRRAIEEEDRVRRELSEFYTRLFGHDISVMTFDIEDSELDVYKRHENWHKKFIPEYGQFNLLEKKYEVDRDGTIIKRFASVKDIPNNYFTTPEFSTPEFSILLPPFCARVIHKVGIPAKPILLKRTSTERMKHDHAKEMGNSKKVLETAIYNADIALYNRPQSRPTYYVFARYKRDFMLANIDVNPEYEYLEIVDWRKVDEYEIDDMINQTPLDGGRIYTLG